MKQNTFTKLMFLPICVILFIVSNTAFAQSWNYVGSSTGITTENIGNVSIINDGNNNPLLSYTTGNIISGSNHIKRYTGSWADADGGGFGNGRTNYLSIAVNGTNIYAVSQDEGVSYKLNAVSIANGNNSIIGYSGLTPNQGFYPSIAMDGTTPYIAFINGGAGISPKLSVMKYDNTVGWVAVGSQYVTNGNCSAPKIAIYNHTPYILFGDNNLSDKAHVMKFNGTSWVDVGNTGFSQGAIGYTSLKFAGSTPYVAFIDQSVSGKACVMKFNGTSWVNVGNAGFSDGQANYLSMTLKDSTPYVVYSDVAHSNGLTLMKYNGSNWENIGAKNLTSSSVYYTDLCFINSDLYIGYANSNYRPTVVKFSCTGPSYSSTNESVCQSALPYSWQGKSLTSAGIYNDTMYGGNQAGCDSILTLNLTFKSTTSSSTNVSICSTQLPYSWNGLTFSVAGSQTAHFTNAAGCDSAATLNLSIKNNYTITASAGSNGSISNAGATTVCSGNNQSYNITPNSGYYISDVIVDGSSIGTNSTYTFNNVTANHTIAAVFAATCTPTSSITNKSICQSSLPYSWNGNSYTQAGSYTVHLTNIQGCDSAATLILTINNRLPAITGSNQVCTGGTIQLSNHESGGIWSSVAGRATVNSAGVVTGTSSGTAVIKYSKVGCITASKNVSVTSLPAIPTIAYAPNTPSPQITGGGGIASICKNKSFTLVGLPSGGTWSSTGVVTINSSGLVNTGNVMGLASITYTINNSGCSSSRTINANIVTCSPRGVNSQQPATNSNQFTLYPNPAHNVISVKVDKLMGAGNIVVTDLYGKQLKTQALSMGSNTIDVSNFAKGMYMVTIITEQGKQTQKVVVE